MTSLSTILAPLEGINLIEWFADLTSLWHEMGPISPEDHMSPRGITQWIHYHNFERWHHEDELRRTDLSASQLVDAKRAIDNHNQLRHDGVEQIDIWIDNVLNNAGINPEEDVEYNSETPGIIIDRLSILSLKIFHMDEQIDQHKLNKELLELCKLRSSVLHEQRNNLAIALDKLFLDLRQVRKRHKVYRQFNMYNDPRFNPALYKTK